MSNAPAKQIVWIDCEMTGLDIERDGLCELAIIITDFDLKPLHPGFEVIINPGQEALDNMGEFVRNMHATSGLLERIEHGVSPADAEQLALDYVNAHITVANRPLVAGNTIGMDRRFISKYLPKFDERMHYRSIDVSTIKELARRWYPATFFASPVKEGGHRALADIAESIRELAYFRQAVLVNGNGPDKKAAEALAATVVEDFAPLMATTFTESSAETNAAEAPPTA